MTRSQALDVIGSEVRAAREDCPREQVVAAIVEVRR